MKRFINILSVIICIGLLFCNTVFADDTVYTDGALLYVIEDDGNITIIEYFGREDSVEVPMAIGEHFVTSIGPNAFTDSGIKTVDLPDTITSIASNAFDDISSVSIKYYDPSKKYVEKENPVIEINPQEKEHIEETKKEPIDEPEVEQNDTDVVFTDAVIEDIQLDSDIIFEEDDVASNRNEHTISVNDQANNQTYSIETKIKSNYSFSIFGYLAILVTFVCVFIIIKKRKSK